MVQIFATYVFSSNSFSCTGVTYTWIINHFKDVRQVSFLKQQQLSAMWTRYPLCVKMAKKFLHTMRIYFAFRTLVQTQEISGTHDFHQRIGILLWKHAEKRDTVPKTGKYYLYICNKRAFQKDAYRPLVNRIP